MFALLLMCIDLRGGWKQKEDERLEIVKIHHRVGLKTSRISCLITTHVV